MSSSTTRAQRRTRAAALPIVAALASALFLAGCVSSRGLAPQLTATDADTLAAARSLGGISLSAADFPQADWWTAFADPQLDALIDEALRDSPTLAAADARARSGARAGRTCRCAAQPDTRRQRARQRSAVAGDARA